MQNEQRHIIALFEKDTKGERSVFSGFLRYSGVNTSWDIRTIVPSSRNAASSLLNLMREWRPDGIVTSLRGFALLRRTTEPQPLRRAEPCTGCDRCRPPCPPAPSPSSC